MGNGEGAPGRWRPGDRQAKTRELVRIVAATVIALAAMMGPYLPSYLLDIDPPEGAALPFLVVPVLVGSFVVTALARPRPNLLWGVGMGFVAGLLGTTVVLVQDQDRPSFGLTLVLYCLMFVVLGSCIGLAGGAIASRMSKALLDERPDRRPRKLRPWHVGAVVAAVDVVVVAIIVVAFS